MDEGLVCMQSLDMYVCVLAFNAMASTLHYAKLDLRGEFQQTALSLSVVACLLQLLVRVVSSLRISTRIISAYRKGWKCPRSSSRFLKVDSLLFEDIYMRSLFLWICTRNGFISLFISIFTSRFTSMPRLNYPFRSPPRKQA